MLINLSNHPYETWDEKQKQTAITEFGNVNDLIFPDVDPLANTDDIVRLAAKYYDECKYKLENSSDKINSVHISGESCFLFQFVTIAKAQGVHCICSTTRRLVINKGNKKTSIFQFVKFRNY